MEREKNRRGGRSRTGKWLRRAAAALLLFTASLALFLFLRGASGEEALPGAVLVSGLSGDWSVLALEERDGQVTAVCKGEEETLLLLLEADPGGVTAQRKLPAAAGQAAGWENGVYVREVSSAGTALVRYDGASLTQISRRELGWLPERLVQFGCDPRGTVYAVLSGDRKRLHILPETGEETVESFPANVEFLDVRPEGVYLWADETLYVRQDGKTAEIPCAVRPLKMLSGSLLLDREGTVCLLGETGLTPVYQCAQTLYEGPFYCLDREICLIVSGGGKTVFRYGPLGEPAGSCGLEKAPLGLCGAGALYRDGGALCWTAFGFSSPGEPGPSPSVSPSPSSSPSPSLPPEEPPVRAEDGRVIAAEGITAEELREYFKPEAVLIRDLTGRTMLRGRLGTGMTAGDWVIVVMGDCDGNGRVTEADLRRALLLCLEPDLEYGAESRAADLNGDGKVDTEDLVALSEMLNEK